MAEPGESPLLPHFIAIRNGDDIHIDTVREGNEHVLGARFADANFFVREDVKLKLEEYRPKLSALTFHTKLGSMLDKSERIEKLVKELIPMLELENDEAIFARRAAHLGQSRPGDSDGHRDDFPARHHRRRICFAQR